MHHVNASMFIRFDPEVLHRLRQQAEATRGATASSLAQRLIDEGLRMAEYRGVLFADGPKGRRRAALVCGPDVWEVVKVVHDVRSPGRDEIEMAAEVLAIPRAMVETAMRYYRAYRAEIDAEIGRAPAEPELKARPVPTNGAALVMRAGRAWS